MNINPVEQLEKDKEEQERKLKKMEKEMEQVFEMKVKEKKKKLKDSEGEVSEKAIVVEVQDLFSTCSCVRILEPLLYPS